MKNYDNFPLLKDFDFGLYGSYGGNGTLLIPNSKGIYKGKTIGFGQLALIPYLQEPFNDDESITYDQLIENLTIEGKHSLVPSVEDEILGGKPFLFRTIEKFQHFGLCSIVNLDLKTLKLNLSKGKNYDTTRVFAMNIYEKDQQAFNGQSINDFNFDDI